MNSNQERVIREVGGKPSHSEGLASNGRKVLYFSLNRAVSGQRLLGFANKVICSDFVKNLELCDRNRRQTEI